MPQVDMSQIPANTQQAMAAQQGATNQDEMTKVLEMLSNDPSAMAQVLQQIGLPIDEQQLMQVAENWVDNAAQGTMGEEADAEVEEGVEAAVPPDEEATGDYTASEAEGAEETEAPAAEPVVAEGDEQPTAPEGNSPMPRGRASGGGSPIDDLISAQMMESAVGNPNAPVPTGGQIGRQQRPGIPANRMPPSAAPGAGGGGQQQQQMIAALFRQAQAARKSGKPVTK